MEQVLTFINAGGESLTGTLHMTAADVTDGVVLGHCFTCSRHVTILRDVAQALAARGIAAFRFDFSGNGQSEGDFSESSYSKQIGEMVEATRMLSRKGFRRFGLAGHSMGAAVAVLAAEQVAPLVGVSTLAGRLGRLATSSLFSADQLQSLKENGQFTFVSRGRNLRLTKAFFDDMARHDIHAALGRLRIPVLVIHGDRDDIIPVEHAHSALTSGAAVRLDIIPGADHMFSDPAHRDMAARKVADWFAMRFSEAEAV